MKRKTLTDRIAALTPRNPFAELARRRSAGSHTSTKRPKEKEQQDLVQRLREAGL